jgi:hypothetical protein
MSHPKKNRRTFHKLVSIFLFLKLNEIRENAPKIVKVIYNVRLWGEIKESLHTLLFYLKINSKKYERAHWLVKLHT